MRLLLLALLVCGCASQGGVLRTDPSTARIDAAWADFCARNPQSRLCGGPGTPDEIKTNKGTLK